MGNATGHITRRDVEVLEFIARFGVVPRSAVETWAGSGHTTTHVRERRLREAGLIEVRCGVWGEGKLLACTSAGLRVAGRGELRPARFRLETIAHETIVAGLAARMERAGERLLSEREMLARERLEGEAKFSARISGRRLHRADLLRTSEAGPPEAIEVELTPKGARRLDELLRAWRSTVAERRLARVVYHCPPATRALVERAVERTRTATAIAIEDL